MLYLFTILLTTVDWWVRLCPFAATSFLPRIIACNDHRLPSHKFPLQEPPVRGVDG